MTKVTVAFCNFVSTPNIIFYLALQPSAGYGLFVSKRFLITQRRATDGRTPVDE
jgi:hypothetical protein